MMAIPSAAADSTDCKLIETLDDSIPHVLKYYGVPGLNLAVARHGEVIWEAGFGFADLHQKIPMTPETVFHSGSMGKTYTATAVMQLIERGLMGLDDPINDYLPGLKLENPLGQRAITFRDLLTHRSGLTTDAAGCEFEPPKPLGDYLRDVCSKTHSPRYCSSTQPLWGTRVGERMVYSNLGIALLGYLVELINPERLSFSAYVQKYIIDPLGMTSTQYPEVQDADHIQPDIYQRMSTGYMKFGAIHLPTPTIYFGEYPAGGVVSIPRDHIRILLAYMNGGRYNNYQLLEPETVKRMLTPEADASNFGEGACMGLVWFLYEAGKPGFRFGHGGSHMWGWSNTYMAFPQQDLAIAIATNHWQMTNDQRNRYGAPNAIIAFATSWIERESQRPHPEQTPKSWAWRVSYVIGLLFVERTNGMLGIATPMGRQLIERIARSANVQIGAAYDERLWDEEGFQVGVADMQAVPMTPEAVRAFMSSPRLQVSSEELKLIYQQLGSSLQLIPCPGWA